MLVQFNKFVYNLKDMANFLFKFMALSNLTFLINIYLTYTKQ